MCVLQNKSKYLLMVGLARKTGIECPGQAGVSYTQFEQLAGSKLHRPSQHIVTVNGKSLQQIIREVRRQSLSDDAGVQSGQTKSTSQTKQLEPGSASQIHPSPSCQTSTCCACGTQKSNGPVCCVLILVSTVLHSLLVPNVGMCCIHIK